MSPQKTALRTKLRMHILSLILSNKNPRNLMTFRKLLCLWQASFLALFTEDKPRMQCKRHMVWSMDFLAFLAQVFQWPEQFCPTGHWKTQSASGVGWFFFAILAGTQSQALVSHIVLMSNSLHSHLWFTNHLTATSPHASSWLKWSHRASTSVTLSSELVVNLI